jgi:glycosyltransferase involved in cell wall biosynthesis
MTSSRPTICQVLHGLTVGGAEVGAARLAQKLSSDFRFTFVCLDDVGTLGDQLRDEGFPVAMLGRRSGVDAKCTWRLAKQFKQYGADLIHAHQYTPFFYSITARLFYRRPPVLFTEHGRWFPDYPRRKRIIANRLLLQSRDRVVGVGENVRQALIHNEGIPSERVSVIYNGIDLTPYSCEGAVSAPSETQLAATGAMHANAAPCVTPGAVHAKEFAHEGCGVGDSVEAIRDEMGVAADDAVIIQVARLDGLKDHATAVRAMEHVVRNRPNARLVLVGEGPELDNIKQVVRECRVESYVRFMGMRRDVPRLLRASDIFLLSSKSEGIPLTIIEAMAAGVPVVSTDVGGIAEIIEHGQTGFLAAAGDSQTLAAHILDVLNDSSRRENIVSRARERAMTVFAEEQMHSQYLDLYREMIDGTSPTGTRAGAS